MMDIHKLIHPSSPQRESENFRPHAHGEITVADSVTYHNAYTSNTDSLSLGSGGLSQRPEAANEQGQYTGSSSITSTIPDSMQPHEAQLENNKNGCKRACSYDEDAAEPLPKRTCLHHSWDDKPLTASCSSPEARISRSCGTEQENTSWPKQFAPHYEIPFGVMQRHVKEYAGDDGSDRTTNTTGDTVAEEYRGESSKQCNASLTKQPAHCGAVSPGEIARHVTEGATVGDLDTSNNSNSSNKSSNTKHTGMQANRCESPEEPAQELCLNTTEAETVSVLGWETESVTSILSMVADSISDWISDSELDTESTADSEVDTDIYPLTQVTPWSPASIVDESELVADSETDIEIYPLTQIVPESPASMPVELESDLDGETLVVDPPYLWALFD